MRRQRQEWRYHIDLWDEGGRLEPMAEAVHIDIANAAFEAAVAIRPGRRLILIHGARIIRQVGGEGWEPSP